MKIVSGVVVEGRKKGRELGFPTANIILSEKIEGGIYSGKTNIFGREYLGAIFIYPGGNLFEIYFLDFNGDLYGQYLTVEMGEKIRDFKKFDNEEYLKTQIADDISKVRSPDVG